MAALVPFLASAADKPISLAGSWRFEMDRQDHGITERWFERSLTNRIMLPGALQNQGFGDDITTDTKWTGASNLEIWLKGKQYEKYREPGSIKVPFCLQPEKHYVGAAWYQRDFIIPRNWRGKRVVLALERAHWETRLWFDGQALGTQTSLSTPHVYELGTNVAAGRHTVTLRIDNRMLVDVGSWAHSVSDHTQGNWNGAIGRIELSATSPVWIEDAQVHPNVSRKSALAKVRIGNSTGKPGSGTLSVNGKQVAVKWDQNGGAGELEVSLGENSLLWDEFEPAVQQLEVQLTGEQADDRRVVTFGLRDVTTEGKQFVLNGRKLFFRGTLECCIFPLTGYPPTDVESWKRIIRACKAHGLNHIRFHSWCPPEAAFVAADELGFYYQVECAVWGNPGENKELGDWLYEEGKRIVQSYGNHPSFVLLTHGNEPHGKNRDAYLADWVNFWKHSDPRRLVTSGSAYPQLPENQYHVYYPCRGPHGWQGKDYRKDVEALAVPVIVHEMGQWCVYPNFDEIRKYKGPLKPKNFDIFRDSLSEHGMLGQWRDFLRASGKLQVLCYKEEIEAALRTPGIGGFQLLDLHDFPGQGTALVGVLDPFWESKGYVSPAEYRRFCNTTVPLARVLKRAWTTSETFASEVEIAHFGPEPLENAAATWRFITAGGKPLATGEFSARSIPIGQSTPLGRVEVPLSALAAPTACRLVVALKGSDFENDWGVWVYPDNVPDSTGDVHITSAWDEQTRTRLQNGGKVLWLPVRLGSGHPSLGFEPIFWNRYMFNTQGRQTLGLLCAPKHPALALFPTEYHQDWQWDDVLKKARAIALDNLPGQLRPIVQVIDDWNTNRKLGLVWECRVGQGKLLVCSADLEKDLGNRPAARQLRASLLRYMNTAGFDPKVQVSADLLEFSPKSLLAKLGATVIAVDSEDRENGNVAANAIDGDPSTLWHTRWTPSNDPMPHQLTIDLGKLITLKGITCLPRQDMVNGRIAEFEFYCSEEPESWGAPAAKGKWPNTEQLQTVLFKAPVRARYLKLVAHSEVNGHSFAGISELDVVTEER
jgi:hypothetical protein